jgi:hypothetical protein
VQPNPHTNWVLALRGVRIRVRKVFISSFLAPPTTKRKQQSNPPKLTIHQTQSLPSYAFGARGLRGGALIMPKTHIMMSFMIFRLALSLVLCLALLPVLCLVSLMDLTIARMVLVHERTALGLDALVTTHVFIVVIVSRVGQFFLLEGLTLTLSRDTWTVRVFPVVVHVPRSQVMWCKRL